MWMQLLGMSEAWFITCPCGAVGEKGDIIPHSRRTCHKCLFNRPTGVERGMKRFTIQTGLRATLKTDDEYGELLIDVLEDAIDRFNMM